MLKLEQKIFRYQENCALRDGNTNGAIIFCDLLRRCESSHLQDLTRLSVKWHQTEMQ